jgi:hypothetical protein
MAKRRVVRVINCLTCPCAKLLEDHVLWCQLADYLGTQEPNTDEFEVPEDCPLHVMPVVLKPKEDK